LLGWTYGQDASWEVSAWDGERLARLVPAASNWRSGGWQMYRIVSLEHLLTLSCSAMAVRAAVLRDFDVCVGITEHDRVDEATIGVKNGQINASAGRNAADYVALSPVEAVRLFLGGSPSAIAAKVPVALAALLPIPVHVPPLDYV